MNSIVIKLLVALLKHGKCHFNSFDNPEIDLIESLLTDAKIEFKTGTQTGKDYYIKID